MAKTFRIAVILEIETANPVLEAKRINRLAETVDGAAEIRAAVIGSLPGGIKRVVAVTGPELMKDMLRTHELACEAAGVDIFSRPPASYEPPDGR